MNIKKWTNGTYPVFSESDTLGVVLEKRKKCELPTLITVDEAGRLSGVAPVCELEGEDRSSELRELVREPIFYCEETDFIEDAALLLIESHDYFLPVVDEDFTLTGVIGVFEILEALMELTAMDKPGSRISLVLEDEPGALRDVVDFLAEREINILSLITLNAESEDRKRVVIRVAELDVQFIASILEEKNISFESISEEEGFGV